VLRVATVLKLLQRIIHSTATIAVVVAAAIAPNEEWLKGG
jgi:hypothetical protein